MRFYSVLGSPLRVVVVVVEYIANGISKISKIIFTRAREERETRNDRRVIRRIELF